MPHLVFSENHGFISKIVTQSPKISIRLPKPSICRVFLLCLILRVDLSFRKPRLCMAEPFSVMSLYAHIHVHVCTCTYQIFNECCSPCTHQDYEGLHNSAYYKYIIVLCSSELLTAYKSPTTSDTNVQTRHHSMVKLVQSNLPHRKIVILVSGIFLSYFCVVII